MGPLSSATSTPPHSPLGEAALCKAIKSSSGLYIVLTRNAFDWAHGFWRHPWHARFHCSLGLDAFVTSEFGAGAGAPGVGQRCADYVGGGYNVTYFYFREGNHPDGRFAKNLMEARTWWLKSWQRAAACAPRRVAFVQFEALLGDDGFGFETELQHLASGQPTRGVGTGWPRIALSDNFPTPVSTYKGRRRVVDVGALHDGSIYLRRRRGAPTPEYSESTLRAMLAAMDREVEASVGYDYR